MFREGLMGPLGDHGPPRGARGPSQLMTECLDHTKFYASHSLPSQFIFFLLLLQRFHLWSLKWIHESHSKGFIKGEEL